ncbi:MAG: multidrug efflux pump subunit AcrA (membrane-fusion protein) [Thermoproteota archaeon]|jgi:multidrug efflux pump subunit AcrA (membrane-fusion protein)
MKNLLVILSFILCTRAFSADDKKPEAKKVFTQKAKKEKIEKALILPALVKSRTYSNIKSQIAGIVKKIITPLGAKVKIGQKLLELKNQDRSLGYRSNYPSSSVEGVVAKILVDKGSYVQKGQDLLLINNPNNLYAQVEISLKDKSKVIIGQKGKLLIEQLNNKYDFTVEGIGSEVSQVSGTVPAILKIKMNKGLISGVLGEARISLSSDDKFLIPETALYYVGKKVFVNKIQKDLTVKKMEVKIGEKEVGKVHILSGLKTDDEFVIRSSGYLSDGDKIEVVKE